MVNQWVIFLKEYAKNNNITYGCAIGDINASKQYKKLKAKKEGRVYITEDKPVILDKIKKNKKAKPKNIWLSFVKQYANDNNISYREALKEGKQSGQYEAYKKQFD